MLPLPHLAQLYPDFFCRYEDPSYLKALKIEVLIAIADATNAYEIAEEMTQVGRAGGGGRLGGILLHPGIHSRPVSR